MSNARVRYRVALDYERGRLLALLRELAPLLCPWCGVYDGRCFHCSRCADCRRLGNEEHVEGCFWFSVD